MEAVNTHIMQNKQHLQFTVCSVHHLVNTHTPMALQRTFQALYLLHKALHSGMRHVTFCCSKQLNRTLLLSSLTWPCSAQLNRLTGKHHDRKATIADEVCFRAHM